MKKLPVAEAIKGKNLDENVTSPLILPSDKVVWERKLYSEGIYSRYGKKYLTLKDEYVKGEMTDEINHKVVAYLKLYVNSDDVGIEIYDYESKFLLKLDDFEKIGFDIRIASGVDDSKQILKYDSVNLGKASYYTENRSRFMIDNLNMFDYFSLSPSIRLHAVVTNWKGKILKQYDFEFLTDGFAQEYIYTFL